MVNENKSLEQIPFNENVKKDNFEKDKETIKNPEQQEQEDKSHEKEEKKEVDVQDNNIKTPPVVDDLESSSQKERIKQIDKILSEDMSDIFLNLPKDKQKEFKEVGEKTVLKINQLLEKTKIKVGQIIVLIKNWLGIIPNANKYYLEQEAKIKTDKIIKLNDK